MRFRLSIVALVAALSWGAAAAADDSPFAPERFLDPCEAETFALIATDLAAAGLASMGNDTTSDGAQEVATVSDQKGLEALSQHAEMMAPEPELSSLDPSNFLDPRADETAALIAASFLVETTGSSSLDPSNSLDPRADETASLIAASFLVETTGSIGAAEPRFELAAEGEEDR